MVLTTRISGDDLIDLRNMRPRVRPVDIARQLGMSRQALHKWERDGVSAANGDRYMTALATIRQTGKLVGNKIVVDE